MDWWGFEPQASRMPCERSTGLFSMGIFAEFIPPPFFLDTHEPFSFATRENPVDFLGQEKCFSIFLWKKRLLLNYQPIKKNFKNRIKSYLLAFI